MESMHSVLFYYYFLFLEGGGGGGSLFCISIKGSLVGDLMF